MNLQDLSTQLLFTTVPIWLETSAGRGAATGFVYSRPADDDPTSSIPLLVTNRHVLQDATRVVVDFTARTGDRPEKGKRVRVEIAHELAVANISARLDVAIIPLAPILSELERSGKPAFFRAIAPDLLPPEKTLNELSAIEPVIFIGYPSGLQDSANLMPVVRQGITATAVWNDYDGDPAFLIDAGVFPGSSGSPVFLYNQGSYSRPGGLVIGSRLLFLGVITETYLRREAEVGRSYLGLGLVTRSDALQEYINSRISEITLAAGKCGNR